MDQRSGTWRPIADGVLAYEEADGPEAGLPPGARSGQSRARRPPRGSGRRRPWPRSGVRAAGVLVAVVVVGVVLARAGAPTALGGVAGGPAPLPSSGPAAVGAPLPAPFPSGTSPQGPTSATPDATAAPQVPGAGWGAPDWAAVLGELDRRRAGTFALGDPDRIGTYAELGSRAQRADAELLGDLAVRGLRAEGLATDVVQVSEVSAGAGQAVLRVVDRRAAYRLLDPSGRIVQEVAASPERVWQVRLRATDHSAGSDRGTGSGSGSGAQGDPGWRVAEVTPLEG